MNNIINKFLLVGDKFTPKDLPKEELLISYYVTKHLILLKMQNMVDIKEVLFQWFINFSIRSLQVVDLKVKLCQIEN